MTVYSYNYLFGHYLYVPYGMRLMLPVGNIPLGNGGKYHFQGDGEFIVARLFRVLLGALVDSPYLHCKGPLDIFPVAPSNPIHNMYACMHILYILTSQCTIVRNTIISGFAFCECGIVVCGVVMVVICLSSCQGTSLSSRKTPL